MHGPFAAVVIATPLEFSSIEFEGVELPHIPARKFQSTVSTFVRGHLNGSYFGVKARPKGEPLLKGNACIWAAWSSTWLLIKLMPKGVVFSFLFFFFSFQCMHATSEGITLACNQ